MNQDKLILTLLIFTLTTIYGCGNEKEKNNLSNSTNPSQIVDDKKITNQQPQIIFEKTIDVDFGVKCTYKNYGAFDYVIGDASEDSILFIHKGDGPNLLEEQYGIKELGMKTSNITKTNDAYQFTTFNGIRETWWRLDRKTAVLTYQIQGVIQELSSDTPLNCVTLNENERLKILNEIRRTLSEEQKKIDESKNAEQRRINDYNNKKPQF